MWKRVGTAGLVGLLLAVITSAPVAHAQTRRASVRVVDGVLTYRGVPGAIDTVVPSSTDASGGTADVLLAAANDMRA
jgi:hypothetical protein